MMGDKRDPKVKVISLEESIQKLQEFEAERKVCLNARYPMEYKCE